MGKFENAASKAPSGLPSTEFGGGVNDIVEGRLPVLWNVIWLGPVWERAEREPALTDHGVVELLVRRIGRSKLTRTKFGIPS